MLEKYNIQTRGFHNVYDEDGNAIGFQLCFRSTYYKGVWLSQVRVGDIIVDGDKMKVRMMHDLDRTA